MDVRLSGKVAIVTGASRGLGRAAAEALLAEGMLVVATGRAVAQLDELRTVAPDAVHIATVDMRDTEAVAALPREALDTFGRLDVVVNNAGIAPAGPFIEQPLETWREVFDVNVTAPAVLAQEAGKILVPQGSGKIINIASTSGITGKPLLVAYSSSKGALIQFTKALSGEWAPHNVQVNAIAPGAFRTDAQRLVFESQDVLRRRIRKIPAGRIAEPEEFAALVCYLASPLSDYVSGSVFVIDGGESAKL